jgi:hypothetical protein
MKKIPLTQGKFALVDDTYFDELNKYQWHAYQDPLSKIWYAKRTTPRTNGKQKTVRMHQQIMGRPLIDHINHNGLDNRRCNLRPCTVSQNKKNNHGYRTNTSGFTGVYLDKNVKTKHRWRAVIGYKGKHISCGYYDTPDEAFEAFKKKSKELYGEFYNG